jgi:hypothetical protein
VDLSATPGRLRLLLLALVLLSLAWGGLAAFTVNQYSSAASSVVAVREPLSLDAQQIYRHLSDADNTAATAFLAGGLEPPAARQRYLADIQAAGTEIENATAQGGATLGGAPRTSRRFPKTCPFTPVRSRRRAPTTGRAFPSAPRTSGKPRG